MGIEKWVSTVTSTTKMMVAQADMMVHIMAIESRIKD
jgi:hypothetical protein